MSIENSRDLLNALLTAGDGEGVRRVLEQIGDRSDMSLGTAFGPFGFAWRAFGDNESNLSTIGLATKPGRSLTERITNAMDALLEDRLAPGVPPPPSARVAAKQWFGRPVSGPDEGMFNWDYGEHGTDRRISVVLMPARTEGAATIDVLDDGLGISADRFPTTILSLQGKNKINKRYLMGTFGQGGASTLRFCEYCLIVSRQRDNPETVSFTVVRELRLGEEYQIDAYAYLSLPTGTTSTPVPTCDFGINPITLYDGPDRLRLPVLKKGTLVRHFEYRLGKLDRVLSSSPGNLYQYLHYSLFDPLLPFRLIDIRDAKAPKNEIVTGSRNRLMKRVRQREETTPVTSDPDSVEQETGSEMKYYRQMEYMAPFGATEPCVGIEYWVIFNHRKGKPGKPPTLRADSNELFVQTGHPILGSLNGQNQGDLGSALMKEVGLSMVARHTIIHIDATSADKQTRKKLFSTNREGFTDDVELHSILAEIKRMLREDENLHAIERELTEKLTAREAEETSSEVKEQVTKLLLEAGFRVEEQGPAPEPGDGGESKPGPRPKPRPYVPKPPLPTLPFPQVTRFDIVAPLPKMQVRVNDAESLCVETDADAEFDRRDRIGIRFEPPLLEVASKALLRGGRVRWRLRPVQAAKAGDSGAITAFLTRMDGIQMVQSIPFEVLAVVEEKQKQGQGQVPPFEILPIDPEVEPERWQQIWKNLDPETVSPDQLATVAYKPEKLSNKVFVFYSTVFGPYKAEVERLKCMSPAQAVLFTTNYTVWIGYHAILQFNRSNEDSGNIDADVLEQVDEADRIRVARMQVKQASQTAELQHRLARQAHES
jgi:hypothetical protein